MSYKMELTRTLHPILCGINGNNSDSAGSTFIFKKKWVQTSESYRTVNSIYFKNNEIELTMDSLDWVRYSLDDTFTGTFYLTLNLGGDSIMFTFNSDEGRILAQYLK